MVSKGFWLFEYQQKEMNDLNLRFERPPQKQLKRFLKTQQQKRDYDEAMDFGEHECREAYLGKPHLFVDQSRFQRG